MTTVCVGKPSAEPTPEVTLRHRADGRLWVTRDGVERPVWVQRCFPWSEPERFLSLRDEDEEVAFIAEPDTLDPESRAALARALEEAGFVLDVTRVVAIDEEVEIRRWEVETAQGPRRFATRLDDWPQALPHGGLLVRDVAGDLYRVRQPAQLDRHSRGLLWAFVD
jgi:Domain of unknown function (DUF1854)